MEEDTAIMIVIPHRYGRHMILQLRFPESLPPVITHEFAAEYDCPVDDGPLRISCGDCTMLHTDVCCDCVVTFLLDRVEMTSAPAALTGSGQEPLASPVVVLERQERDTLQLLQEAGMAPRNQHISRHPAVRSRALMAV